MADACSGTFTFVQHPHRPHLVHIATTESTRVTVSREKLVIKTSTLKFSITMTYDFVPAQPSTAPQSVPSTQLNLQSLGQPVVWFASTFQRCHTLGLLLQEMTFLTNRQRSDLNPGQKANILTIRLHAHTRENTQ